VEIVLKIKSKSDGLVHIVRHSLSAPIILGRGPESAAPLDAPGISREHLEVRFDNGSLFLTDLSSNGSWLNGARMPQRGKCKIKDDDVIELPGYELRFALAGVEPQATVALPGAVATNVSRPRLATPEARSLATSFSGLELFLFVVALASAALLFFYLAS
jgi:pSer/pThr/pTyr-binding forkhead associated (FHA) protein